MDPDGSRQYSSLVVSEYAVQEDAGKYSYESVRALEEACGITERPTFTVANGPVQKIELLISPLVSREDERYLVIRTLDSEGNLAEDFRGEIRLEIPEGVRVQQDMIVFDGREEGHTAVPIRIDKKRVHRLNAHLNNKPTIRTVSHPFAKESGAYNVYLGEIHAHSALSDGAGTPDEYYTWARDVANLSISALADHGPMGREAIDATERYNEPGRFVTILGWEWSASEGHHKNIYYPNKTVLERTMENTPEATQELFEHYKGEDVLIVPHHPNFYTELGWKKTDWGYHEPDLQRLVEICQGRGNSETMAREGEWGTTDNAASVRHALERGYKLGFLGGTDDHFGHPGGPVHTLQPVVGSGTQQPQWMGPHFHGITGFLAGELTREAIWGAMRARRTYATTGARVIMHFEVNGRTMGTEIRSPDQPVINVRVDAEARIFECALIKNGSIVLREYPDEYHVDIEWIDDEFDGGEDPTYYYVRIRQVDGHMAWASPVWVRA